MESLYSYAGSRKLFPFSSFPYAQSTSLGPVSIRAVDDIKFKRITGQSKFLILPVRNAYHTFITACSWTKGHSDGTLHLVIDDHDLLSKLNVQSSPKKIEGKDVLANNIEEYQVPGIDVDQRDEAGGSSSSGKNIVNICESEMERRKKIGLANKGRIPWNKGRTHSKETRDRISKRTIEALSDPKVRKRMSECPRSHSDQSKGRISSALRKIWEKRLQQKKLQENCYLSWARSIAEAAKEGYPGQEKLEWDSYERMKSTIISQYLQQKAERARAKEIAKLKAEKAAKIRAENAARHAQLRKEREEKAKVREMKALARKKSEEMKMKMALSKGLKLRTRFSKVHHPKKNLGTSSSIQSGIEVEHQPIVDNLDIDHIKLENMRQRISLADQIQAVKNRKGEFNSSNFLENSFISSSSSEVEAEDF
ncbi:uncharacterized protein A4U43_C05F29430 [Asparagus officinalis]|uniref:Nuclease associated modular domain-containing protein n=1 Tax=Asparagus officinalis TaxID=4686 RepID=A0A5P1EVT6_ASPOF|nr:uncharacterized protein LOC109840845 [Asparagus officinalis]XP_020265225.1 uncharacterized protein LOC109840845 [Asparagus officinalis]XP_020265226.1 uncharacterized protein LOC109840845 [Asparagus officinalis]ONK70022.1 uncharacterized protein A4U43_C05F29430 [Asparagus officinalis]